MPLAYRLEVQSPATSALPPKTWAFTPDTGNVASIEAELKKEKHRISVLTAVLHDPKRKIFGALPDPAFANVPIRLYLSKPGSPQSVSSLAFDGKVTSFQWGYPGYDKLTIVAHDQTVAMRMQKKYRLFKNKSSVQVAQAIALEYGFTVDASSLGAVLVQAKSTHFGPEQSDWDFLCRSLAADGLEVYTAGSKLVVRQAASLTYATSFQPDLPPVVRFEVAINYVHGSGEGGDKSGSVALESSGTAKAAQGALANELARQGASARTHLRPVSAPAATTSGSHAEDPANQGWTNQALHLKRRKDSAVLTCQLLPDVGLQHQASLAGWGAKIDGHWTIDTIKHLLIGADFSSTTLNLRRGTSPGAANSAGIAFAP